MMIIWEYQIRVEDESLYTDWLHAAGVEGWELCAITETTYHDPTGSRFSGHDQAMHRSRYHFFLKRKMRIEERT